MKITTGIIAVIAIFIGGGVYLLSNHSEEKSSLTNDTSAVENPNTSETIPKTTSPQKDGTYVEYSSSVIANTAGTKILFFYAPWCPQCRALDASIKSSKIPDNVTIIKVDYDSHQALRQKYEVTIQTTLVKVDDNGSLVKKYVAYDEPTLNAVKENLL